MNAFAALAGLAGLARLAAEALPAPIAPSAFPSTVYLLRPEDYAHPARRMEIRREAEARGGRWILIGADWKPLGFFATAENARFVLKGAGFKGPGHRGLFSKWER
jgi:hypothetical protein